jgi:ribose 5-phosphate isomerase B
MYNGHMLYLGADRHGFHAISMVEDFLRAQNIPYENLGVAQDDEDVKLEALIPKMASAVLATPDNKAILSCGTGVGVEVGINKFAGIRACLAADARVAGYSRVYDDANVLCLVGWNPNAPTIEEMVHTWLASEYDGSEARLDMFKVFDSWGGKL